MMRETALFTPSCVVISDDVQSSSLYLSLLNAEGFDKVKSIAFKEIGTTAFEHTDIVIIDIVQFKQLQEVRAFFKDKEQELMLISPFSKQESILENSNSHFIAKPIDFKIFSSILKSWTNKIIQMKFLRNQQTLLLGVVEKAPIRIGVFDVEGRLVYANREYLKANKISNLDKETLFNSMLHCRLEFSEILLALSKRKVFIHESQHNLRWYMSQFYYVEHKKHVTHICSDVTSTQHEIETLSREALFFKHTNEGVVITDEKGIILAVNDAFCKITGYTKDESIGKSTHILSSGMHGTDFYQNMWDTLHYYNRWQGEIWNRRKNGEVYPEWLSISGTIDPKTGEKNYLALFTDISSIKETDKKLQFYANHDHLTGLLNRVQCENMVTRAIKTSQRNNKKFALLFIDLDHFKEINDSYGHNIGDILLKRVATLFQKVLRSKDVIARIGGDEFNILIEDIEDDSDVVGILEKLLESVRSPIIIEGYSCFISLSIGVAIYPIHGLDSVALSKNADAAMYEVKKRGRDGYMLYNADFTNQISKKVALQNDLKQAIVNKELLVYFQPVIDIKTDKINRAEALVRWKHPKKGFISPTQFIPLAEQHGIIIELGQQVMKQSFIYLRDLVKEVEDFELSINISARELFAEDYVKNFFELAEDFGIDLSHVELEITETHIMKNYSEAIEKFKLLKQKGVSLAIDDFGTGYSSLSYLKNFPIDKLKIDQSFVFNFLNDKGDRGIVESVINLGKVFGLEVQAEGVETQEHVDALKELECSYLQGYYYAKAMDFNSFLAFMRAFNADK